MANPHKGEYSFEAEGRTYIFVMDMDAMCACEAHFSTPERPVYFTAITAAINAGSMTHMRVFLWAALQRHQPDVTLNDISPLVQVFGGVVGMRDKLLQMSQETVPDQTDVKELGIPPPNPPPAPKVKAKRGTGAPFRSMHGVSA